MTDDGPANEDRFTKDEITVRGKVIPNKYKGKANLKNEITTTGCEYKLSRSSAKSGEQFIFTAVPAPNTGDKAAFNVVSCFDLRTGASDLKRGSKDVTGPAEINDLVCW